MRELPGVTLACIDTTNHALALRALAHSSQHLRFARVLLLTSGLPAEVAVPAGVDVETIDPIGSRDEYSRFVLKDLVRHVSTSHVLLVQWDGFVANPDAWEAGFLDADYVGAKWFWFDDGMRVGNGGFSLRSRRLLEALADPRITLVDAEDLTIGRAFRPLLEREHGIRFADEAMADRFAFEAAYPIGKPFGFHGLFNFCRVVSPAELTRLPALFSDAIARSPQCKALLRNCLALNQWEPGIAVAARILAADPGDREAQAALAQAQTSALRHVGVGRNDPCPCGSGKRYKSCHGAAPAAPSPDALTQAGIAAHRRGDLDGAERQYRAALAVATEHPAALHYLGVVLYQRNRLPEALPLLDRAAALVPHEPEFHNNRGLGLAAALRDEEAILAYRRALALQPAHAGAWNNLGLALQATGNAAGAIAAYREALRLAPDAPQTHWNLALALLLQGDFAQGFPEYEWRLRAPELQPYLQAYAAPRWNGDDPNGRTVLVSAEQGLGDTLQNLRFARAVAARGARVIAVVQPPLRALAATVPGIAAAFAVGDSLPAVDAHAPLLSLPGILAISPTTIPAQVPYLRADPVRIREAQAAVARGAGVALNVGLAWSGGAAGNAYNLRRSCSLATLAPLLELPGTRWFSLQREGEGMVAGDEQHAASLAMLSMRNDFDGTAALVEALDLVISVDTSLVHLAGALGKPVWVLLPFAPDWRWLEGRADSPWYPTARLFRQHARNDWSQAIARIASALRERIAAG